MMQILNKTLDKKRVGGFILLLLVLLIFCSKTVYRFNLPEITATKPQKGSLNKVETASGISEWAELEAIYAQVSGTVGEVLVREGETVQAGQPLCYMEFDRDEIERKLKETASARKKLQLDIQDIQLDLAKPSHGSGSRADGQGSTSASQRALAEAQTALADARLLYEEGAISLRELERAEKTYADAQDTDHKTQTSLKLQLEAKTLELQELDLQEEPYRKVLHDFATYAMITAPVNGQITQLTIEKGTYIREKDKMAEIGMGDQFKLICAVPLKNNFIIPGDICKLSNASHNLKGEVLRIVPTDQGKTVEVSFVADKGTAGETFEALFEKKSETSYTLIPNGALFKDNDGYFVNQIKRRDGMMGQEYYLERLTVYIGDSDANYTAIVKGITFMEPLMLLSDKPVNPGAVVTLKNAGDFFAE